MRIERIRIAIGCISAECGRMRERVAEKGSGVATSHRKQWRGVALGALTGKHWSNMYVLERTQVSMECRRHAMEGSNKGAASLVQLNENGRPWYLARCVGGAAHSLDGGFEDQPQSGPVENGAFQETVHHGDNAVHERQAPECRLGEIWAVSGKVPKKTHWKM